MRKSYIVSMAIVLIAFVGMMLAADMALKPMRKTMAIGTDVAAMLSARGDLAPDSKMLVFTVKAGKAHLATEGFGMVIELQPSDAVRKRPGRLEKLARRAIREIDRLYEGGRGTSLTWFEVRFMEDGKAWHRALFAVGPDGDLRPPAPAIPAVRVASLR